MKFLSTAGIFAGAVLFLVLQPSYSHAQSKKGKEVQAHSVEGKGVGENPNIKNSTDLNDPNAPQTRTKAKDECFLHVDNHTPWHIRIYLNGDLAGEVTPWGDSGQDEPDGTIVIGAALFSDGTVRYWGPETVDCSVDGLTWSLYR
jgi:hypothetical protein